MRNASSFLMLAAVLGLAGCADTVDTTRPDYRVGVMRDVETGKMIAVAKDCPEWHNYVWEGIDNHTPASFGCADKQNLARMIDRPSDLLYGRRTSEAESAPGIMGIERYREGKTKQLINPKEIPPSTTSE